MPDTNSRLPGGRSESFQVNSELLAVLNKLNQKGNPAPGQLSLRGMWIEANTDEGMTRLR